MMIKQLKRVCYTMLALVCFVIVLLLGAFFYLSEKPKNINIITDYFVSADSGISFYNSTISKDSDGNVVIHTSMRCSEKDEEQPFLDIHSLAVRMHVNRFFTTFRLPVSIEIAEANVNLNYKNINSKFLYNKKRQNKNNNKNFSIGILEEINKITSFIDSRSYIYISSFNTTNSIITQGDINYKLAQTSFREGDKFDVTATISNRSSRALINNSKVVQNGVLNVSFIHSDEEYRILSSADNLSASMIAKFVPMSYSMPALSDANPHLKVSAEFGFSLSYATNAVNYNLNLISKNSSTKPKDANDIKELYVSLKNSAHQDASNPSIWREYINVDKFKLVMKNNEGEFEGNARIYHTDTKAKIDNTSEVKINLQGSKVDLKNIEKVWPYGAEPSLRKWLSSNIHSGIANTAKLTIDTEVSNKNSPIIFDIDFEHLDLSYFEKFEKITNISGKVHIDTIRTHIDISEADIVDSKLYDSSIDVNYSDSNIPISIRVNADGRVKDFIHLAGDNTIANFHKKGIYIDKSAGKLKSSIFVEFPLAKEFKLDNTKINVVGDLEDFGINFYDILNLSHGSLDLKITNKLFFLVGKANINGQSSNVEWSTNIGGSDNFDNKLVVNTKIGADTQFERLLANKLVVNKGEMLGNFIYVHHKNKEQIVVQFDMDKAEYSIPDIGLYKPLHSNSSFNFDMTKYDDSNWKTERLELISDDINVKSFLELDSSLGLISFNTKALYNENDFSINIFSSPEKIDTKIHAAHLKLNDASLLQLTHLGPYQKLIREKKPKEVLFSVNIDKAQMKNDILFHDIVGNFECYNRVCKNSALSMKVDKEDSLKISLNQENNINVWTFKATHAAKFLKAFGIYKDIQGGYLYAEIKGTSQDITNTESGNIFTGRLHISDFHAIKTPLIMGLLLESPFVFLSQELDHHGLMHFNSLDAKFLFSFLDHKIRISSSEAESKTMNISARGYLDLINDTMSINGDMTPKYNINSIFRAMVGEKNFTDVIFTNYTIQGPIKSPRVRVNPIGMFMTILLKLPGVRMVI